MQIYLVWLNDMLLDAYVIRTSEERARLYRESGNDAEWKQLSSGRWCQPTGRVARLDVEARWLK